jgi:IEC3 subunit of the Ino80 complex, chromatin re-modelling
MSANSNSGSGRISDALSAQSTLQKARQRLRDGEMVLSEYHQLEEAILDSPAFVPQRSYTSLLKVPHTLAGPRYDSTQETLNNISSGCLTAAQEEQYLEGIDSFLAGKSNSARPHAANNLAARSTEKSAERERELQLRNPVSVYNWLRKHQPQVFLQDHESHGEKQTRPGGSRASKRASVPNNASIKQEHDLYDDDGIALDANHTGRGKRKRDDDPGYRPKGGNSRPLKRKKEDGPSVKKSKKQSITES